MFSEDLIGTMYADDRMRSVPIEYQSTVLRVVQEAIEKRYNDDKSQHHLDTLKEICYKE
ncbi:MAG: hypothetical protein NC548_59260 [Lachnospiraceae bacterium]|nr:hypothetical protein [Lachnospiraceae bacterium]